MFKVLHLETVHHFSPSSDILHTSLFRWKTQSKYNSLLTCCGFDIKTKDNEQGPNKQP